MLYREYGKTGKSISLLSFGGLRFADEDTRDEAGLARCVELVKHAASLGVNYFDTAPNYCNSQSEIIFGRAFREISSPVYVATKSTILAEKTAAAVRWRVETSLERLGLEKIHFFNMWAIIDMDQYRAVMAKGGPYEGAMKAKEEGLVEHVAFSTHCTGDEIAQIVEDGCFEGVTIGYNALNYRYRRKGLEAAHRHGLGVIVMNPLHGGLIPSGHDHFDFLAQQPDEDPITSALRFVASHEEVTSVLSGMKDRQEVDMNVAALSDSTRLGPGRIRDLERTSAVANDHLCTTCRYCDGCPVDLPLYKYMDAYNMSMLGPAHEHDGDSEASCPERAKAARVFEKLKMDWRELPRFDSNPCIQCGECESKCTQHIGIIRNLEIMFSWGGRYGYDLDGVNKRLGMAFDGTEGSHVGIYGTGYHSENMFDSLRRVGRELHCTLHFFDSNPLKWGTSFMGFVVQPPDRIKELGISRLVVSSAVFQDEIYESVKHLEDDGIEVVRLYGPGDIPVF